MKNNLVDLNNYLFEELERLNDDEALKNEEQLDKELKRSKAIAGIAKTVISNANVLLNAKKYCDEMDYKKDEVPKMLRMDNET